MIRKTFITELEEENSKYDLISFSRKPKKDNKLALVSRQNKSEFNLEKNIYKNELNFELAKVHEKHQSVQI